MVKKAEKIWESIQTNHKNVKFRDLCTVIEWFNFKRKGGKGSHKTYFIENIREIIDIQPLNSEAKPYQIKQFIRLVEFYHLKGGK